MTREVGVYSPSTAKIVLDVVRYLRANGFIVDRGRGGAFNPPTAPIHVKNTSGEEVPAYACMQAIGTTEKGGQNYVDIDKPADIDGTSGWYLFNGPAPIEIDGFGVAFDGPFVRVLTDGSTITAGDKWQPMVNDWTVEPGGAMIIATGPDDIAQDVMRGFVASAGDANEWIEYTITSLATADGTDPDFVGLKKATVEVRGAAPASALSLVGETVTVYDHSGCIFDEEDMEGYTGWALWGQYRTLDTSKDCDVLTPSHWAAINRCCAPDSGTYRDCE